MAVRDCRLVAGLVGVAVGLWGLAAIAAGDSAATRPAEALDNNGGDLLLWQGEDGVSRPVKTPADWRHRRERILADMQRVMGPLPAPSGRPPLDVRVVFEERMEKYRRLKIGFMSERGDRVPAWLLIPHDFMGPAPAALCLHQTVRIGKDEPVGLGGKPNLRYAGELADRGYVVIAPDYPNFGEYRFDPYANGYASATMKGIVNHIRAVDVLAARPEVDAERIGCIGHSLGGHNALFVAVFDKRIKATVTSCGFTSFEKYYNGDLTGWSHKGYMPRIEKEFGKDPKRMPFDFPGVLAAIAPRAVFVNAPTGDENFEVSGVKDCVRTALPIFELLGVPDRLVAEYPDAGHDFPPAQRAAAYRFLDKALRSGQTRGEP